MSRSVGGNLGMRELALLVGGHGRQYPDREAVRAAARELRSHGLTDLDIGEALGIAVEQVAELLKVPE